MNETSKAAPRRAAMPIFQRAFTGRGIDIGGGNDPLRAEMGFPNIVSCESFDRGQGDAAVMDELRCPWSFDFVYSSQTLEDMENPMDALKRWARLVTPGGFMVVSVPDFELYERGQWPSIGNGAHRTCWGIGTGGAATRGAPYVNVLHFLSLFTGNRWAESIWQVLLLQLVDTNFDYSPAAREQDQTCGDAEAFIEWVLWRKGW